MHFESLNTRTVPTIKVECNKECFFLHSKYDPKREAQKWVNGLEIIKKASTELIVIGMGAGHHIRELLNETDLGLIFVFDFNNDFSKWVSAMGLIDDLIISERVKYLPVDTFEDLDFFSSKLHGNIVIYQPALKIFEKRFLGIREKLENLIIQQRTIEEQQDQFRTNFSLNLKLGDPGILSFTKPTNQKMILVSAGPSLTKQLPVLRRVFEEKSHIIAAVGTAYKPLIESGIIPDFLMISDPKDQIMEQFDGCATEHTTLFYLSTANHGAVSNFRGSRFIVFQGGFGLAEKMAIKKLEPTIKTGGSVATCLLDLMVYLGAKKIALVGQDLAFTDGESHAKNTHAIRTIAPTSFLKKTIGYYGDSYVYTARNLAIYLEWFKQYILNNGNVEFWNCTEGGAHIDGWIHRPLIEYLEI